MESPDKRVFTKQACRDESIVSVFFPISYILRSYISSTVQQKNQNADFLSVHLCLILPEAQLS